MVSRKEKAKRIELEGHQKRALHLLKIALDEVASDANIQNISVYRETEHGKWRLWAETTGTLPDPANEPSTAWAIFREDLPHDVVLRMQANFYAGAAWIEVSLLPIAVLVLNTWGVRLNQSDAKELFGIDNEKDFLASVHAFVVGNLKNFILLLPIMLYDMWDDPLTLSTEAYVEQEVRPYFRKRWRALGFPKQFVLFPELRRELEQNSTRRSEFQNAWRRKTQGGFREKDSFDERKDFASIMKFVRESHKLWQYVTRFFADHNYEESCPRWIVDEAEFKRLSQGVSVPPHLLRQVLKKRNESRVELSPLSFAIEHARRTFEFKQTRATVLRHYHAYFRKSSKKPNQTK